VPRPWPATAPTKQELAAYAGAKVKSFWVDDLPERPAEPPLTGTVDTSLCIVGGGFTGLWAALHAKADDPRRDVILLEADRIGEAASGRNGGFCISSLTHGIGNGHARFSKELVLLERLSRENYDGLVADLARLAIACDLEETGELIVALEDYQLDWLGEEAALMREYGHEVEVLDGAAMRSSIASPTYLGGIWDRRGAAVLHPGKLVDGLRSECVAAGVRMAEHSPVSALETLPAGGVQLTVSPGMTADAVGGVVRAERVVLASGAHPSLAPSVRRRIAPVYDYVLMTEPLTPDQLASIGWADRQGVGDAANQFHYYRLTADGRILWGGYDAVYRYGGPVDARYDAHEASFARLSQHFFTTFPQLRGVRFTHRWGGAIDTCSRFSVFFATSHGGRVASAAGYTGLGVCASRFGARVAVDLVDGRETEATRSSYVRSRPLPFPPEPLRSAAIGLTQRQLERADATGGRRGAWLRALDRVGLGFDS
jgi:glycine/D-amino acid oxidase-like deaminating enzyme